MQYGVPYLKPYIKPYLSIILTHTATQVISFHINLLVSYMVSYLVYNRLLRSYHNKLWLADGLTSISSVAINIWLSWYYERLYDKVVSHYLSGLINRMSKYILDEASLRLVRKIKWGCIIIGLTYITMALWLIELNNKVLGVYVVQYIVSTVVYETVVNVDGDYSVAVKLVNWYKSRPVIVVYTPIDINEKYIESLPKVASTQQILHSDGYLVTEDYM
jgi:hypothetical protein